MPLKPQETGFTCGPRCLSYAFSLHGIGWSNYEEVDEKDIRNAFGDCRKGSFDKGKLSRVARKYHLNFRHHHYMKPCPGRVIEDIRMTAGKQHTCIVSWRSPDRNHFHWME